jgi:hypothetical protein
MAESAVIHELWVEGIDDQHTIIHLLDQNGIKLHEKTGPVIVKPAGNDLAVLRAMPLAVNASTGRAVGFVLDADMDIRSRWQAVGNILSQFQLTLPAAPSPDGFIAEIPKLQTRVGVWIMPDNVTSFGALEDFVRTLVPQNDLIFPLAEKSTKQAQGLGAHFSDKDRIKAELHAWLAWQEEPGRPFGVAIKARYFEARSDVADLFVEWFKRLFLSNPPG